MVGICVFRLSREAKVSQWTSTPHHAWQGLKKGCQFSVLQNTKSNTYYLLSFFNETNPLFVLSRDEHIIIRSYIWLWDRSLPCDVVFGVKTNEWSMMRRKRWKTEAHVEPGRDIHKRQWEETATDPQICDFLGWFFVLCCGWRIVGKIICSLLGKFGAHCRRNMAIAEQSILTNYSARFELMLRPFRCQNWYRHVQLRPSNSDHGMSPQGRGQEYQWRKAFVFDMIHVSYWLTSWWMTNSPIRVRKDDPKDLNGKLYPTPSTEINGGDTGTRALKDLWQPQFIELPRSSIIGWGRVQGQETWSQWKIALLLSWVACFLCCGSFITTYLVNPLIGIIAWHGSKSLA